MQCPYCNHADTRVTDSRIAGEGRQIRRRRECLECGERFTTYEAAELSMPRIVKADERREAFDIDKLTRGMMHALEKRPVGMEDVEAAVERIKNKLLSAGLSEVPAREVGDWVMEELHQLDHVAYIRFASVYLSFEGLHAFRETIEKLETQPSPEMERDQISLIDRDSEA